MPMTDLPAADLAALRAAADTLPLPTLPARLAWTAQTGNCCAPTA